MSSLLLIISFVMSLLFLGSIIKFASAADFTIADGQTVTATQFLNNGEVGTIENGGTISTTSGSAVQSGGSVTITNNGTLNTSGGGARGVLAYGSDTKVSNTGNIITTGNGSAEGIRTLGDNSSIISSGSASTSGSNGFVISATGQNSSITNSGTVTATGEGAHGLNSEGLNNTINNSNTVSTTGMHAYGIRSTASNATITNSGTVSVSGTGAIGLNSTGADGIINLSGKISVSGTGAIGLSSTGTDGIINLSGKISATGNATQAILGSNNQTLNIYPGAKVVGTIDLGGGTNSVNIFRNESGEISSVFNIKNHGTINYTEGLMVVSNEDMISVVDPTALTATPTIINTNSVQIQKTIGSQLAKEKSNEPVRFASNEITPDMFPENQTYAWVQAYAENQKTEAEGFNMGYKSKVHGLVGAIESQDPLDRFGIFGGLSQHSLSTDDKSTESSADVFYGGVYDKYNYHDIIIDATATVGIGKNYSERKVIGGDLDDGIAKSHYYNLFISPSILAYKEFEYSNATYIRPSTGFSYTASLYGSYEETGSTDTNLNVSSRIVDVFNTRIELAGGKRFMNNDLTIEAQVGAEYSYYGNDSIHARLDGGPTIKFKNQARTDELSRLIGLNILYEVDNNLEYYASANYKSTPNYKEAHSAILGIKWKL